MESEELQNTAPAGDEQRRESGSPGGGAGRVEEVGQSGVYPGTGPFPPGEADVVMPAEWGQGERGAEGYHDAGSSELSTIGDERAIGSLDTDQESATSDQG